MPFPRMEGAVLILGARGSTPLVFFAKKEGCDVHPSDLNASINNGLSWKDSSQLWQGRHKVTMN